MQFGAVRARETVVQQGRAAFVNVSVESHELRSLLQILAASPFGSRLEIYQTTSPE